ncbi:MAG: nucleotidyltransferase domain-containing protein [Anaerolineales bacterium]
MRLSQLKQFRQSLQQIAQRHGVKRIFVFGSVARGGVAEPNDVDFLIEMEEDASALGIGGFQFEAQSLLGTRVDVVPTFALPRVTDKHFIETIELEALPL